MKDTAPAIRAEYYRRVAELSPDEKGRILSATFSSIRAIVRHSLRHLPEPEQSIMFIRRVYGLDFDAERLEAITREISADFQSALQRRTDKRQR